MRARLLTSIQDAQDAILQLQRPQSLEFMEAVVEMLVNCFRNGGKVLIAGNGGSLCDAVHFAEELTGFFRSKRPALPVIALSEPGHLTCAGNDLGFQHIFSRGVEAYGKPGDVFIGLSTSGNSPNIIQAVQAAKERDMFTIAFLGKDGGKLKGETDLEIIIEGFRYSDRIQEAHMACMHMIIEMLELKLFYPAELDAEKELIPAKA